MKGTIEIKREKGFVTFEGDYEPNYLVSDILEELNSRDELFDVSGKKQERIEWSCSCLRKLCGTCAMLINGKPKLACETFFRDAGPKIRLEPLSKFPLISDLRVDRSKISKDLQTMDLSLLENEDACIKDFDIQFSASECLHCGCCLEVCPNYNGVDNFFGPEMMITAYRAVMQKSDRESKKKYLKIIAEHGTSGCSKSLSCEDVCPMEISHALIISKLNHERFKMMLGLGKERVKDRTKQKNKSKYEK